MKCHGILPTQNHRLWPPEIYLAGAETPSSVLGHLTSLRGDVGFPRAKIHRCLAFSSPFELKGCTSVVSRLYENITRGAIHFSIKARMGERSLLGP